MVGVSRSARQFMVWSVSPSIGWLATDILCYQTAGAPKYTGKPDVFLLWFSEIVKEHSESKSFWSKSID